MIQCKQEDRSRATSAYNHKENEKCNTFRPPTCRRVGLVGLDSYRRLTSIRLFMYPQVILFGYQGTGIKVDV